MTKRRYPINAEEWLTQFAEQRPSADVQIIQKAIHVYAEPTSHLEKGLAIADILLSLGLDTQTLASTIIYPQLQENLIEADTVIDVLGETENKLLFDVLQMQSLNKLKHLEKRSPRQVENLRKMLLAMVTDVRSVLIILAERVWELRKAKQLTASAQKKLATETLEIYAPLANRLGVWQLKWEIEDLSLRCLHPDVYLSLAKGIATKRDERETYINQFRYLLNEKIKESGIKHFEISGRVKHIFSIYKKMQRKNADLNHIYDMSALRVLVDDVKACYEVLAILQNNWSQIPEEFDDYISQPKSNGYQSIHMVLIGPDERFVEVQIRTYQMHHESELGVAAHWRYKEGVLQPSNEESKIALLRQIIAWQKEVANAAMTDKSEKVTPPPPDLFAEQVYVFTPMGDIIELPQGATPLDFAYTIHSEVGHRCRGAKVDGSIVPLTFELSTGQRVEILTGKAANPSRDWLNAHLKYLKSTRNRAKVQHWFRIHDSQQALPSEKEHKNPIIFPAKIDVEKIAPKKPLRPQTSIQILGVNNLLTHIAKCCKPLPGDKVLGYVTRNRGVTIHRLDCNNVVNIKGDNNNRKIEVDWENQSKAIYSADLIVKVEDRPGIVADITMLLNSEKINFLGLQTEKQIDNNIINVYLTIEVASREQLKNLIEHLKRMPYIIQVNRG